MVPQKYNPETYENKQKKFKKNLTEYFFFARIANDKKQYRKVFPAFMICSFTMKVINMKFNLKIMKNFKSDINNTLIINPGIQQN